jgi:hypothetical protein
VDERKKQSRRMAEEVQLTQMLTSAQLEAAGLFEPKAGTLLWHKTPSGGNPAWLEVTAEMLQSIDCLEPLLRCREKLLHKDFLPAINNICRKARADYVKHKGTTFEWGLTIQPNKKPASVQMSSITRESALEDSTTDAKQIFCDLLETCAKAASAFIPEFDGKGRDKRRLAKGSLLPSSWNNAYFTSMQINFANVYAGLGSLKKFGLLHPDIHDDVTMLTALIVLSHNPPNYCNGRFNVTSLGISAPLRLCSIYYVSARNFHCGTGHGESSVPEDSPLKFDYMPPGIIPELLPAEDYPYKRLTIPIYADWRLMEPKFKWLNKELYSKSGAVIFQDEHEHYKWMVIHYIAHEPEILGRILYTATYSTLTYAAANDLTAEGSGPEQMCQAAITCKVNENEDPYVPQPRNGNPDHYVRLFAYKDPATGATVYPSRELVVDALEAVYSPNTEFQNLTKEFEAVYCGSKNAGEVQWEPLGARQAGVDQAMDTIPSNPGYQAGDSAVGLEQLIMAGSLAFAAQKVKAAAKGIIDDAVVRLSRDPFELDDEAKEARKKADRRAKVAANKAARAARP